MKTTAGSALVLCATVCLGASAAAQTPVGALAIDERQGDQYGWAVDYETAGSAQAAALRECGAGCSVVLTFERCAAYAADQDADSTAVGWAESYSSSAAAQQSAVGECSSRGGGSGCIVRVWGCNGPVVEDGLSFDRAARRAIQEGLQAAGFDPGGADGMFGPRTRTAIWSWQTSRGARATGHLDGASEASLRPSEAGQPTFREREPAGVAAASSAAAPAAVSATQQQPVGHRGAGEPVLAVDREQHEPCGVRGVSVAVPERGVPGVGRGAPGGAAGGCERSTRCGRPSCWRRWARRPPAPGCPALGARRSVARPASTHRDAPGRSSATARSARRWWCWQAAVWRWAATR